MRQLSTDLQRNYTSHSVPHRLRRYRRPNLPVLFYNIIGRNWQAALRRIQTHPHEMYSVEDSSGDTPLHFACRLDPPVQVVESLMPICYEKNKEGATPLHVAASQRCSIDVISTMVDEKYSLDGQVVLTLSLTNMERTPLHYACSSFRGLGFDAFRVLLQATIKACSSRKVKDTVLQYDGGSADVLDDEMINDDISWVEEAVEEKNAFTLQDRKGNSPLSLLFKRYRERVKYVIRSLERTAPSPLSAARTIQDELGGLWLKARLLVCLMAESKKESTDSFEFLKEGEFNHGVDVIAQEAARWAAQRHQSNDYEKDDEDDDIVESDFRLVHSSVALTGYGCPLEMIRLAISVYPNQVREMDADGNLPLHIAAVSSGFVSSHTFSDEDSLVSNLSNLSASTLTKSPFAKVIRLLLDKYPEAIRIPHGTKGKLPLIMAIDAKQRTMEDGLQILIDAFPAALEAKDFDMKLYPNILSLLAQSKEVKVPKVIKQHGSPHRKFTQSKKVKVLPNAIFDCIKARPSLLSDYEASFSK
ncbi:hypothetical protein CTEN210_10663 [Chaetoceros tenuissimus]|uniref:Uncharacterized protein n=1 Tax=Chaetoceros tenuissimus TaxID=426638 RepID=A0AAD3CY80_9STRA|nr:hypothetical protein CTEN210_10663 [Chaetoceros tenuissimus]